MPRDDLDAWFRTHPRLRRYHMIYDGQQARGVRQAQRSSWIALLVLVLGLYTAAALRMGSWWAPLELFKSRLTAPHAASPPSVEVLPSRH
ncbi:MAG: hypothetical protein VKO64_08545 [Candidatus Sericytochromatia bacterium]|nr:hypothetical protein [Candidatus Sericytochromatia bacterium]